MIFKLEKKDASARAGILSTARGQVQTPCFMPVGTQATVKALSPRELEEAQAQIVLANAYHLFLRPGMEVIRKAGGLHNFMSWPGVILTDSGGYQIFSLALLRKISDEGAEFQSHIDGAKHFLTPEAAIEIQQALGADIMMPLDECLHYPAGRDQAELAMQRTLGWAKRSQKALGRTPQILFGIMQGATYEELRRLCSQKLLEMDFAGYAVGGVSVGEPRNLRHNIMRLSVELLPADRPRYLMGVGLPEDILEAVAMGYDMFDCVVPTRYGRNGTAFTSEGKLTVRNAAYSLDERPLDKNCSCYACRGFSRSYLRHLFNAEEILGLRLVSLHNVHFFLQLLRDTRQAIVQERFLEFRQEFLNNYNRNKVT
jgi:queuine tRNA-ribosyltransferase